jgi:hypothetical protein
MTDKKKLADSAKLGGQFVAEPGPAPMTVDQILPEPGPAPMTVDQILPEPMTFDQILPEPMTFAQSDGRGLKPRKQLMGDVGGADLAAVKAAIDKKSGSNTVSKRKKP